MATLIDNVWLDGRYYGPDHGNADAVPADLAHLVPASAWSTPPATEQEPAGDWTQASKAWLVAYAESIGIEVRARWSRADLVAAIEERAA